MAWFKIDDRLPTSRKFMRIPRSKRAAAIGVWTLAGAWSMHDLTDGFVPAYMIEEWGGDDSHAQALVDAGMWSTDERDGDPGYQFVNWDKYQPTRADVEERRERDRERKRAQVRDKGGKFAGRTVDREDSERKVTESEGTVSDSTVPLPSPPLPISHAQAPETAPPAGGATFDDWWAHWPKKVDKGHARTAYKAALKKTSAEELLAAVQAYAATTAGTEKKYIPNPATWLNGERWEDDTKTATSARPNPAIPDWMLNG